MSSSLRIRPTWNSASEMTPVEMRQATKAKAAAAAAPAAASHRAPRSSSSGLRHSDGAQHASAPPARRPAARVSGRPARECGRQRRDPDRQARAPSTPPPPRTGPARARHGAAASHPIRAASRRRRTRTTPPPRRCRARTRQERPAGAASSAAGSSRVDIGAGVYPDASRHRPASWRESCPASTGLRTCRSRIGYGTAWERRGCEY